MGTHTIQTKTATIEAVLDYTPTYITFVTGAHSIGRAHPEASGYRFVWIPGGQYHLDNRYYSEMINRDWQQVYRE